MRFAIVDSVTLKVKVTSYSRKLITAIFDSGFKTQSGMFKITTI